MSAEWSTDSTSLYEVNQVELFWTRVLSRVVFPKPRWDDWLFFWASSAFRALSSVAACFLSYTDNEYIIYIERDYTLLIMCFYYLEKVTLLIDRSIKRLSYLSEVKIIFHLYLRHQLHLGIFHVPLQVVNLVTLCHDLNDQLILKSKIPSFLTHKAH